jgi:hypothetical protein
MKDIPETSLLTLSVPDEGYSKTGFWNILHQVHSTLKDWKTNTFV